MIPIDLDKLMLLEKRRINVCEEKLVFIGIANLSKYYWCAWQYFLKSKRNEFDFFSAYIMDRIKYSEELGIINEIPDDPKEFLAIGDDIGLKDVQFLLEKVNAEILIDSSREDLLNNLKTEIDPLVKGNYYEQLYAEKYPTIRWNFRYKDIILLGIPDGINDELIYEFKYVSKKRYLSQTLRTARLQADLYGYFFNRPKKKIQIYCKEEDKIYSYFEDTEKEEIVELLEKWIKMINGELPKKPMAWKCNICDFKDECNLIKS